ncbi:hypothetical protein [Polaromonas sp. CG_9.11]|uniref:hypothetical protein n=1 Tax=Polaromonas sp. CG_9.11 TaxID=2787730 RepID=UPI0018C8FF9B|nr:hypothetical protein [Polaromonas sp. CG_9.11]MBG6074211.1 hypothetical protein [Polaromonas sp. CG_9.11]
MARIHLYLPLEGLPINIPNGREAVLAWINKEPHAYLQVEFTRNENVKAALEADSTLLDALRLASCESFNDIVAEIDADIARRAVDSVYPSKG